MANIDFSILDNYKVKEKNESVDFSVLDKNESSKSNKPTTNNNLSNLEVAGDVAASTTAGAFSGASYLLDMPQLIGDGIRIATDKGLELTGNLIFGDKAGTNFINRTKELREKTGMGSTRIEPGKAIRENIIKPIYKPKTKQGEYGFTAGEFAAPGGIVTKGSNRLRALFASTGAVSGLTAQAAEDLSGSEAIGTGTGIGLNVALDLLALRKGNLAGLAQDLLPEQKIIEKIRSTQKAGKEGGLPLTVGESSGASNLIAAEANIATQKINAKAVDAYYESRPKSIINFIKKFGKDVGLIKSTFTGKMSSSTLASSLKKSANLLQSNRQRLWENSGGLKFRDSYFDSQQVDNLAITLEDILNKSKIPEVNQNLFSFVERIKASGGKGSNLHNVYKDINDLNFTLKGKFEKTGADIDLIKQTQIIKDDLTKIFSANTDFAKANKTYQTFTKSYFEPLEKFKIFKRITASRWETNMDTVGKVYKLLGSDAINKSDIAKIAKSFEATGDKKAWNKIVSSYFDQNFLKAQASNNDLSKGINFSKGLVGSPRQKDNVTEMLFQVAKQQGYKGSRSDIGNAVNKFSDVLKSSGSYVKSGSPTAIRQQFAKDLGKNPISTATGGIPILSTIDDFFFSRTYSQNSKALSEALMSPNGIDELINLAKNWKDKNASIIYTRNIILTAKTIEEMNQDID